MRSLSFFSVGLGCLVAMAAVGFTGAADAAEKAKSTLDLTHAVVVTPPDLSGPEKKAVVMLIEEAEKRTHVRWHQSNTWPVAKGVAANTPKKDLPDNLEYAPVIAIGQATELPKVLNTIGDVAIAYPFAHTSSNGPAEGYQIQAGPGVVWVAGNDARGVLFGVGHLLRSMALEKNKATLPATFKVATAPHDPIRGHQLGYRPKTNSYDAWNLAQWEQYIRDLAVFGTNAIELIPPRSDDADQSPHFPLPKMEMMIGMSQICADYGIDVWIWYPAMDEDYSNPKTVEFALKEWGDVFKKLPRIDAVFVPGGDPGHSQPRYLMDLLEKETEVLHRYHPRAGMWVSPQGFTREWMDEFLGLVAKEPAWLTGVVHGPQVRVTTEQLRAAVPKKYLIRNYPDITHSRSCQFPVPDWDTAFAVTEARETINPRPLGEANIFRHVQKYTNGSISYSEGCNDDVNKFIWSGLGWDPDADVTGILRDFSRYFIGPRYADNFAQGLLTLEKNWVGPALTNANITTTLQQFQEMEKNASPQDLLNWRFQQALYRAYYDAYVRSRLIYETRLEDEALSKLREARRMGAFKALDEAEKILEKAVTQPTAEDLRTRVFELGEALFQSIHMQLNVARYQGQAGRGTNLDTIDRPLNSRQWLLARFADVRRTAAETDAKPAEGREAAVARFYRQRGEEAKRAKQIDDIVNWTDPGPGGFYDDLGNSTCQPHLVVGPGPVKDPANMASAMTHFEERPGTRKSWWDQSMALYDNKLNMRYTRLDPTAHYKVRVVYGAGPIRLVANDKAEIHPLVEQTYKPLEYNIPAAETAGGVLNLSWSGEEGRGSAGRGCQVAEVWLIKGEATPNPPPESRDRPRRGRR